MIASDVGELCRHYQVEKVFTLHCSGIKEMLIFMASFDFFSESGVN